MDAQEYALRLREQLRVTLSRAGHSECSFVGGAEWIPDQGAAVCGCGWFTQWSGPVADPASQDQVPATDPLATTLDLIDPTTIYTPEDVERHILEVLWRLETGAKFERASVEALFVAQREFDRAFNRAVDESEESAADRRKASAMVSCEKLADVLHDAKMEREAVKATLHNLRSVLSGYQSVARSVGATYQAGGSPGRQ